MTVRQATCKSHAELSLQRKKNFYKVCRAFSILPDVLRGIEARDYFWMQMSISETPLIDEAFIRALTPMGKSKTDKFGGADLSGPEGRKAFLDGC